MRRVRTITTVLALLAAAGTPVATAHGQQPDGPIPRRARAQQPGNIEQLIRQRIAQVVRRQLGLNDEQMRKLVEVNRVYEPQMLATFQRERRIRLQLQAELTGPDSTADQQLVDQLMNEFIKVQRDRIDLVERENRELAAFLTPVQRVKLFEIRNQIRRRLEEQRRNAQERRQGGDTAPRAPF